MELNQPQILTPCARGKRQLRQASQEGGKGQGHGEHCKCKSGSRSSVPEPAASQKAGAGAKTSFAVVSKSLCIDGESLEAVLLASNVQMVFPETECAGPQVNGSLTPRQGNVSLRQKPLQKNTANQKKCRILECSLSGYVYKTTLNLRLRERGRREAERL